MPIVPTINSGTAPQVRRPRPTVSESEAVSGPFAVTLTCSEAGKYRPAPNVLMVRSPRLAVTASPDATVYPWGQDYAYAGDVGSAGVAVGYLWIKSIDANGDGLDDLESAGSVTLSAALATFSDGLLDESANALAGVGNLALSGSGLIVNVAPLAGVGLLGVTGSGALGLASAPASQPLAGVGNLGFTGSGALGLAQTLPSMTGTYYPDNAQRAGGIAGDNMLVLTGDRTLQWLNVTAAWTSGDVFTVVECAVLDSSGNVARTLDRTEFGHATALPSHTSVETVVTSGPLSFTNPAVASTEYFALRFRFTGAATADSPWFTLPQGVNPGSQSAYSVVLDVAEWTEWDDGIEDYVKRGVMMVFGSPTTPNSATSRIVFSG